MITIYQATAEQARTLTDRIKVGVEGIWQLIEEAYNSRAYLALGYKNWDEYCTREFGTSRLRLPREERAEVVASLRESGLSIRAVAAATGAARNTVRESIREVGQIDPPAPAPADEYGTVDLEDLATELGVDLDEDEDEDALTEEECEALDAEFTARIESEMAESSDADVVTPQPIPSPVPRITGTDGKSYPVPPKSKPAEPAAVKRKPLTDAFWHAAFDLGKEVKRIQKLSEDDRFSKNADQIAGANLPDLIRARDALQCVIDKLSL